MLKLFKTSAAGALALCGLNLASAAAQTIVVNPGGSIQSAVNSATAGTTIRVTAGVYTQKVLFSGKSGTSANYITLKADPGVTLSGTGLTPTDREGLITIRNSSYVKVEGFDIQNFVTGGGQTPCGILVEGSGTRVQLLNNKIHNIRNNSTCQDPCAEGAHGLAVFGTSASGITDLLVQGNEVYGNVLQASEALVINGNVDRFEVLDNNVHDNNNIGFDFIGYEGECSGCGANDRVRNGVVRGNTAANNSTTTNPWYGNSGSAGGFYVDGGQYIVFERNVSTGNDLGFEFASEHPGKATEDILMVNNFVSNNRDVGVALGGYASGLGEARRIRVYNNSFYKNKGFGTEVTLQYKVINCAFGNNIFFGKGTAAQSYESIGTGSTGNVWGTNLWWGTSTASGGLPGTKILQNPLYVAPAANNLRLSPTSPAINAGTLAAGITTWPSAFWDAYFPPSGTIPANGLTDIDGQARVEATIDLGADETGAGNPTAPSAPSALAAAATSSSQITLTWADNSANETGFVVERSLTSGAGYAPIATTASNATSYQDTGLAAATTYYYRVAATNSTGTSAYSNGASATTQSGPAGVVISVDGNLADWAGVASISTAGAGGLTALKAYSDATNLYILAQGTTNTNYVVFLNHDNVTSTGFRAGLWSPEGSNYSLENGVLYKYSGTGSNWSWTTSGVTQTGIAAVKTASVIEVKIPKSSLVGLASTIKLGVDVENASWTTVATIPAQGGPQATYVLGTTKAPRAASASAPAAKAKVELYPNPSSGTVHVSFVSGPNDRAVEVGVFTTAGVKVAEFKDEQVALGRNEKTFAVPGLRDGLYVVKMKVGSTITTQPLVLTRNAALR